MAKPKTDKTAGWVLVAAGVGVGLYFLLRSKDKSTVTQQPTFPPTPTESAAPPSVPSVETPTGLQSLGAVSTAYDDLESRWKMGLINNEDAHNEAGDLIATVDALQRAGIGDSLAAYQLTNELAALRETIVEAELAIPPV